ncbi:flavin-dependent oxidoreductase [Mycobacterium sp. 3519A]|uniref:flavin-dependent oxidoreductase n=1 Tax=Mycobacterium sp. 3519A TaxID=2057184 RepID=UPI000C7E04A1|nr:flavin-dependent oxidoreductase [Mycobacterium sp. 3519A]
MSSPSPVTIVGAGIGGLVLALELHSAGIPCRIYEAAPALAPLGVGINILPHACAVLAEVGVLDQLAAIAVTTRESVFFNRFGQLIYTEPAGRFAGYPYPQLSIHRGDLQLALAEAVVDRMGAEAIVLDHTCVGVTDDGAVTTTRFRSTSTDRALPSVASGVVIACDGVHSAIRKQLFPDEGSPRYSGVLMWRGTSVHPAFLSGASMVRAGWLATGKMVIYPIRDHVDAAGHQLINWVAEIERPYCGDRDWGRPGRFDDFLPAFADWRFDWLDVHELILRADAVLEYPMVDQEPLPRWTFGGVTLLGDAAHPMVPRGSNGAGQAILDARSLRSHLQNHDDPRTALRAYEHERRPQTQAVVLANRTAPPDAILREVWERSGDRPFDRLADIITDDEIASISQRYKDIAGLRGGTT